MTGGRDHSERTAREREALWSDIHAAHRAIERVTEPDHVNVASLGNLVPHLHWHIKRSGRNWLQRPVEGDRI